MKKRKYDINTENYFPLFIASSYKMIEIVGQ